MNKLILLAKLFGIISLTSIAIVILGFFLLNKIYYIFFIISLFICYSNFFVLTVLSIKKRKFAMYFLLNLVLLFMFWFDAFGFVTLISE